MGFFSHDDSDERQAYEQVQREGSTCKLTRLHLTSIAKSSLDLYRYLQLTKS